MKTLSVTQKIAIADKLEIRAIDLLIKAELTNAINDGINGIKEQLQSKNFATWAQNPQNYEKLALLVENTVACFYGYDTHPWARIEDIILTIKWAVSADNISFDTLTPSQIIYLMSTYGLDTYENKQFTVVINGLTVPFKNR